MTATTTRTVDLTVYEDAAEPVPHLHVPRPRRAHGSDGSADQTSRLVRALVGAARRAAAPARR